MLFYLFSLSACLEKIDSVVNVDQNFLVIDGLITNENESYIIKLTRSMTNVSGVADFEKGATVYVEDQDENQYHFSETEEGVYQSNPLDFVGQVGNQYRLIINTIGGESYRSDWCIIGEPSFIDSVYYKKVNYYSRDQHTNVAGLQILVDATACDNPESYLRWDYEEAWKFHPTFRQFITITEESKLQYMPTLNYTCWKENRSSSINIRSFRNQSTFDVIGQKIIKFDPFLSDRVSDRYSIKVKQYTISREEYQFWKSLEESSDSESHDMFGKQPYSTKGNVRNLDDSERDAIGFFQVASVTSKRIFINRLDLPKLGLRVYRYDLDCHRDTVLIDNFQYHTIYDIYNKKVLNGASGFVSIVCADPPSVEILGLVLSRLPCCDCTHGGGVLEMPEFWEE